MFKRSIHKLVLVGALLLTGCSTYHEPYRETHVVNNLKVEWLDRSSLQAKYEQIANKPAVALYGTGQHSRVHAIRGFYDFKTGTIYCSKGDFEACGHELHHAILGYFHEEEPLGRYGTQ